MSIAYPLINGLRYDFSSCELIIAKQRLTGGIKSIDYSHSLEPGIVRGNRAQVIGRTRGEYNAEGSMELYALEFDQLATALQLENPTRGIMEVGFQITVAYSEAAVAPVIVDNLFGCRITKIAHSAAEGGDGSTYQLDLHIMHINQNGKSPLGVKQLLK